jgi:hypothetical protein
MHKPLICEYRIHAHRLKIETGWYLSIDRQERICDFCNYSCIEDEFHFILKCNKYDNMRKKYIKPYYWKKPSAFKLVQLFLYSAEKVRNCLIVMLRYEYILVLIVCIYAYKLYCFW